MDPHTLLQSIETTLKPEIEAFGGLLDICEDELAALQVLHNGPLRWCCLLILTAGKPLARLGGTHDHENLTLTAYVAKPVGMPANPAAGVYRDTAAGAPLLARVSLVRQLIQRILFVEPYDAGDLDPEIMTHDQIEDGFTFTGWQLLGKEDAPDNNHACRMTFTIAAACTAPAAAPLLCQLPVSTDPAALPPIGTPGGP